jgi:hypothetical protein
MGQTGAMGLISTANQLLLHVYALLVCLLLASWHHKAQQRKPHCQSPVVSTHVQYGTHGSRAGHTHPLPGVQDELQLGCLS